jgi:allantoate deiminase
MRFGPDILEQADYLATCTHGSSGITRTYLSGAHKKAGDYLLQLMRNAGMDADYDAIGNVVGRYAGRDADAPVILTGSHQDSVVDAGRYDGVFGILSPIACVADLKRRGVRLSHGIEVIAFGDEEGVRFDVTMIGSAALAGSFDAAWLERRDDAGVTMRDALHAFGGAPDDWRQVRRDPRRIACFVESHIEQGPVLLTEGLAVGVVTAIAGVSRLRASVVGVAGHAGTVPMPGRRDALAAAAEMALAIEALAQKNAPPIVATVGKFAVAGGGAINVIAGKVEFTVDLRSPLDAVRRQAVELLIDACEGIAKRRGVSLSWQRFFDLDAAPCDAQLQDLLAEVIAARGVPIRRLPSGAGHDAMKFAGFARMAMLFVRCGNGGISHNPLETMTAEDADIATEVLLSFMENFPASAEPSHVA